MHSSQRNDLYSQKSKRARTVRLVLTPYLSDYHHERSAYFATQGLPSVIVDARGRGNSEGHSARLFKKRRMATMWSNGSRANPTAMARSPCGVAPTSVIASGLRPRIPAALATIVPTAAPYIGVDFPMRNNIFFPYLVQWITLTSGRASQSKIFSDGNFWSAVYRQWHESGRPFRDLDAMLGNPSRSFRNG